MTAALTCMCTFVYFEVLAAREHLAAARKQTRERLLARMYTDVVDELVLGLERAQLAAAVAPQTHVVGLLAAARHRPGADVLHTDVRHQLVHRGERPATHDRRRRRQWRQRRVRRVHPLAEQFLLHAECRRRHRCGCRRRGRPEVREEAGAGAVVVEGPPSAAAGHAGRSQTAAADAAGRNPVVNRCQLPGLPL